MRAGNAHTASTAAVHALNVARAKRSAAQAAATAATASAARAQAAIAPARAAHDAALPAIPAAEDARAAAQATAAASAGTLAAAATAAISAAAQVAVTPSCAPADVYSGASTTRVMSRSGTVITRYTKAGRAPMWVTEINLAGPGVRSRTGPIGGPQIASRTQQSTQLAGTGAIAAVNGDFFSVKTDNSPLGPVVERGARAVKGTKAHQTAVILQRNGLGATGNLWLDISLRHGGATVGADALNTDTLPTDGIAVFTARWGTAKRTFVTHTQPVSEYLVSRAGVVIAVHSAITTAAPPAGGMVLLAQGAGRTHLSQAGIVTGATVSLATAVHSDAPAAVETALGVGRSLLKDGVAQYPQCEQDTSVRPHHRRRPAGRADHGDRLGAGADRHGARVERRPVDARRAGRSSRAGPLQRLDVRRWALDDPDRGTDAGQVHPADEVRRGRQPDSQQLRDLAGLTRRARRHCYAIVAGWMISTRTLAPSSTPISI